MVEVHHHVARECAEVLPRPPALHAGLADDGGAGLLQFLHQRLVGPGQGLSVLFRSLAQGEAADESGHCFPGFQLGLCCDERGKERNEFMHNPNVLLFCWLVMFYSSFACTPLGFAASLCEELSPFIFIYLLFATCESRVGKGLAKLQQIGMMCKWAYQYMD